MTRALSLLSALVLSAMLHAADYVPHDYVWTTQSKNSSESMPCGGHDIGMNVWVENGDLLWYVSQSGWFDANNTLLKAGRWRLHLEGDPFGGSDFRQTLRLDGGYVEVTGGGMQIVIWADVIAPCVYLDIRSRQNGRSRSVMRTGATKTVRSPRPNASNHHGNGLFQKTA